MKNKFKRLSKSLIAISVVLLIFATGTLSSKAETMSGVNTESIMEWFSKSTGIPLEKDEDGDYIKISPNVVYEFEDFKSLSYELELDCKFMYKAEKPSFYFTFDLNDSENSSYIRYEVSETYGTMPNLYSPGGRIKGSLNPKSKPVSGERQTVIFKCTGNEGGQYKTELSLNGEKSGYTANLSSPLCRLNFMSSPDMAELYVYDIRIKRFHDYNITFRDSDGNIIEELPEIHASSALSVICETKPYKTSGDIMIVVLYDKGKMADLDIVPLVFEESDIECSFEATVITGENTENSVLHVYLWSGLNNSRYLSPPLVLDM